MCDVWDAENEAERGFGDGSKVLTFGDLTDGYNGKYT